MSDEWIKPIETAYKGCRFRSRLEARWAVFFDALGIESRYEAQGYKLRVDWYANPPHGLTWGDVAEVCYLPDFWLPQVGMYAEVKPAWPTVDELALAALLAQAAKPVLILDGMPDARLYWSVLRLDFNAGAWDVEIQECDIQESCAYWRDEGRFWTCDMRWITNPDWNVEPPHSPTVGDAAAIRAARSARFEFGECG